MVDNQLMKKTGIFVYSQEIPTSVDGIDGEEVWIARENINSRPVKSSTEYFYPPPEVYIPVDHVSLRIAAEWFRDESGRDCFEHEGISIGSSLLGSIEISLATALRDFIALRWWSRKVDSLVAAEIESPLFKLAAQEFEGFVKFRPAVAGEKFWFSDSHERMTQSIVLPSNSSLYRGAHRLFRVGQTLLQSKKARSGGVLVFGDWTQSGTRYSDQPHRFTNVFSLVNGAFLLEQRRYVAEAEDDYRLTLNENEVRDRVFKLIKSMELAELDLTADLCAKVICREFKKARAALVKIHAVVAEAFDYYKPDAVQVSGILYEPYAIAMQLASRRGIFIRLVGDGHDSSGLMHPRLRSSDGTRFLINEFCVGGRGCAQRIIRRGVPPEIVRAIDSPMFAVHPGAKRSSIDLDIIIMTWSQVNINVSALPDSPARTLYKALSVAGVECSGLIGIKLKSLIERRYVEAVVEELGLTQRVKILEGKFVDYVLSTPLVVGGLSTTAAECAIHGVPYVIFEPRENGYSDDIFGLDSPVSIETVARDEADLVRLIRDRRPGVVLSRAEFLHA